MLQKSIFGATCSPYLDPWLISVLQTEDTQGSQSPMEQFQTLWKHTMLNYNKIKETNKILFTTEGPLFLFTMDHVYECYTGWCSTKKSQPGKFRVLSSTCKSLRVCKSYKCDIKLHFFVIQKKTLFLTHFVYKQLCNKFSVTAWTYKINSKFHKIYYIL